MKFKEITTKIGEFTAFSLLMFLVYTGVFVSNAWAQAVTTVTDFVGTADISVIGSMPYYLGIFTLLGIPPVIEFLRSRKGVPSWVLLSIPTVLSLVTAAVTALAMGYIPWEAEGLNVVLVMVLGGVTGQSAVGINRKRVLKNAKPTFNHH